MYGSDMETLSFNETDSGKGLSFYGERGPDWEGVSFSFQTSGSGEFSFDLEMDGSDSYEGDMAFDNLQVYCDNSNSSDGSGDIICEHPVVTNAVLTTTEKLLAGEKYTIVCNEGYSLLNIDAEIYGSKTVAVVPCRGMELEDVVCYQNDDDDYETYSAGFRASAGLMTLVTLLVILAE